MPLLPQKNNNNDNNGFWLALNIIEDLSLHQVL